MKHPVDLKLATVAGRHLFAANEAQPLAPRLPARRLTVARRHQRAHPPFFNGRVWFGIAYVPRPMAIEQEAERLQRALLDPRTAVPIPRATRALNVIRRLLA